MLLIPESECTTSTFGAFISSEIGAKSLIGSYGRFLNSAGLTAIAVEASRRVWPSGVARATCAHADVAGGAAAVVDHHLLAERLAERKRQNPRDDVGRPAGRERDDERDGAVGKGSRGPDQAQQRRGTDGSHRHAAQLAAPSGRTHSFHSLL